MLASDVEYAISVLLPKLQTKALYLHEEYTSAQASFALNEVMSVTSKEEKARQLFAWCDRFLLPTQWKSLKAAIRKRRQRKLHVGQTEVITVSKKAHELLRKISKRDDVTFSETLEYYLAQAWKSKARR